MYRTFTKNTGFSGIYSVEFPLISDALKWWVENVAVEFRASNILIRIEPNCFENVRNDVDLNIKMMNIN